MLPSHLYTGRALLQYFISDYPYVPYGSNRLSHGRLRGNIRHMASSPGHSVQGQTEPSVGRVHSVYNSDHSHTVSDICWVLAAVLYNVSLER